MSSLKPISETFSDSFVQIGKEMSKNCHTNVLWKIFLLFCPLYSIMLRYIRAGVLELADETDSKSTS